MSTPHNKFQELVYARFKLNGNVSEDHLREQMNKNEMNKFIIVNKYPKCLPGGLVADQLPMEIWIYKEISK
ncbi:hypothetical protein PV327_003080 [Microctonus hyperodae]|uniref:Uncharacterized protein n=1 Tax=Microctonus hyperodae TaxID=165561 RepID=A0AA39G452_MICHY|nr:hypothetical protein PV327_003080 [Microctonus hyperodae]